MVLKDPAGTLDDRYRRMLEEGEKSCARLAALVSEISDLSGLEAGTAPFKRAPLNVRDVLAEAVAALPDVPDRTVTVLLEPAEGPTQAEGDAPRLKTALTSVLFGLRREVVNSDRLVVRERIGTYHDKPADWISIGDPNGIDSLSNAGPDALATFDEWRGGCGLTLAVARRIIDGHGGAIWSPAGGTKAGAVVVIPLRPAAS